MTPELEAWLEKNGPVVCEVSKRRYTCYRCNKGYRVGDPAFSYYKPFGPNHFLVRLGLVREGDPQCLRWAEPKPRYYDRTSDYFDAGHETYGWFARCVDEEQCERYRTNNHAGVHYEQEAMAI